MAAGSDPAAASPLLPPPPSPHPAVGSSPLLSPVLASPAALVSPCSTAGDGTPPPATPLAPAASPLPTLLPQDVRLVRGVDHPPPLALLLRAAAEGSPRIVLRRPASRLACPPVRPPGTLLSSAACCHWPPHGNGSNLALPPACHGPRRRRRQHPRPARQNARWRRVTICCRLIAARRPPQKLGTQPLRFVLSGASSTSVRRRAGGWRWPPVGAGITHFAPVVWFALCGSRADLSAVFGGRPTAFWLGWLAGGALAALPTDTAHRSVNAHHYLCIVIKEPAHVCRLKLCVAGRPFLSRLRSGRSSRPAC